MLGGKKRGGRPAGKTGLKTAARPHAAAGAFDDLTQLHPQRQLKTRSVDDMAADAEQFHPRRLRGPGQSFKPLRALADNTRHIGQTFSVIDHGWAAPEAFHRRKRRFCPGIGPFAFQGVHQGGLLAADIASGGAVHIDSARKAAAKDVLAQQSRRQAFGNASLQVGGGRLVTAPDKDKSVPHADGIGCQYDSFQQ